jgi:hypothetical protein
LLKPKSGLLHIKGGQFDSVNSGKVGNRSVGGKGGGVENRRLEEIAALRVQNGTGRRRLELLHSGGELGVVGVVKQWSRLHNVC